MQRRETRCGSEIGRFPEPMPAQWGSLPWKPALDAFQLKSFSRWWMVLCRLARKTISRQNGDWSGNWCSKSESTKGILETPLFCLALRKVCHRPFLASWWPIHVACGFVPEAVLIFAKLTHGSRAEATPPKQENRHRYHAAGIMHSVPAVSFWCIN